MAMDDLHERHRAAKAQVHNLRQRLQQRRRRLLDTDIQRYAQQIGCSPVTFTSQDFVCCRTLQGHTGKVYSLDCCRENNLIVSASQDGRLIVWNALTSQKIYAIKLPCAWVMACAFAPGGKAVACGGLDNVCSIFLLNSAHEKDGNLSVSRTLTGHSGYISCCQYTPDNEAHLITSSGDGTCILWDSETGQRIAVFGGDTKYAHTEDVMSLSINARNSREFVSGSIDKTASLWDTRVSSRPMHIFSDHYRDVNTVKYFPDGLRFGTGSDDSNCRIFDIRTGHQLQLYSNSQFENRDVGVTSIAFSYSGRLLFSAYSNEDCYIWDTLTAEIILNLRVQPDAHTKRVSCLGLAVDGSAICTGSWDQSLKVWAFNRERPI